MINLSGIDYSALDRLGINRYLFYPRPDYESTQTPSFSGAVSQNILIPVETDVVIGATFHAGKKHWPNVLFFHGNGEIASDYADVAGAFIRAGLNFLPVDYRGYGRSTGTPSVTGMMRDSHRIFSYVYAWLKETEHSGAMIVMGRSLGSASALELVASYGDKIDGLIIESGFAQTQALLQLFGVEMGALGLSEEEGFRNLDKVRTFGKPTLIIHAEFDHLLHFNEGQALYEASPASEKTFLKIPRADHNDIFALGKKEYMRAVKELASKAG